MMKIIIEWIDWGISISPVPEEKIILFLRIVTVAAGIITILATMRAIRLSSSLPVVKAQEFITQNIDITTVITVIPEPDPELIPQKQKHPLVQVSIPEEANTLLMQFDAPIILESGWCLG